MFVLGTLIFVVGVVLAALSIAYQIRSNRKLKSQAIATDGWALN